MPRRLGRPAPRAAVRPQRAVRRQGGARVRAPVLGVARCRARAARRRYLSPPAREQRGLQAGVASGTYSFCGRSDMLSMRGGAVAEGRCHARRYATGGPLFLAANAHHTLASARVMTSESPASFQSDDTLCRVLRVITAHATPFERTSSQPSDPSDTSRRPARQVSLPWRFTRVNGLGGATSSCAVSPRVNLNHKVKCALFLTHTKKR